MNNDPVTFVLDQIKACLSKNRPISVITLDLARNIDLYSSLQGYLLQHSDVDILVDQYKFFSKGKEDNERPAFNQFVISWLKFVRDVNVYSMLESIDLMMHYINSLIVAFNNYDGLSYVLLDCLTSDIKFVYEKSLQIDKILAQETVNGNFPILTNLSTYLSKLFNNCKKNQFKNATKKQLLLKISNYLVVIYFKIDQPLNCNTIFITEKQNFKTLKGSDFCKRDLIKYRYYLGKYLLIVNGFPEALTQFTFCYKSYPISQIQHNPTQFDAVLQYFVVSLLLNGYKPSSSLISNFQSSDLTSFYSQLISAMKWGNLNKFYSVLEARKPELKRHNLYNLMLKYLAIIVYRNLFYLVYRLVSKYFQEKGSSWQSYDYFKAAIALADGKNEIDTDSHLEEVFVSLNDKKWVRGVVFPLARKITFAKNGAVFPDIKVPYSSDNLYKWLDS